MTYSIVARDIDTGELGVAVQTCHFAVGSVVPWARAGIGAVASQAITEPAHGPRCLDAMERGANAQEALAATVAADPGAALRQIGVIDASGRAEAFTGELCIDYAGHQVGKSYAVQANMMASPDVWPAMASTYESARGPLAERLLAALLAAEDAGGDARGRMSAALVVVSGECHDGMPAPAAIDLRVDDHATPLVELARLLDMQHAFEHYGRATEALFAGEPAVALQELDAALTTRDDENFRFARAGALLFLDRSDEARLITQQLVASRPSWATVIRSFATKGLFPVSDTLDIESFL